MDESSVIPERAIGRGEWPSAAVWLVGLLVALSRWPAVSATFWDWDEALFGLALVEYDVTRHHPHPPGFPLFVGLARVLPLDGVPALQAVVFAGALLLFPAMFFLVRSAGAPRPTALSAALLLVFFPNVWFYGGTAMSDVPSLALALLAAALLLSGRSQSSLLVAGVVAGLALGFRPQNGLVLLLPGLAALRARPRAAAGALAIAGAIAAASYGAAAWASGGWQSYVEAVRQHESYIRETDSILSSRHPSLWRVADDFFYRPFRAPWINGVIALLLTSGVLRLWRKRERRLVTMLAIFGPFCLLAWLMLDWNSAGRFSIAYMPLVAFLAAEGVPRRWQPAAATLLAGAMAVWAWPGIAIAHRTPSPPVVAARSLAESDPGTTILYVDRALGAHAQLLLPGFTREERELPTLAVMHHRARALFLGEGIVARPGALHFERKHDPLEAIARRRYFATSVAPVARIEFTDGWFGEEGEPLSPFRWMSRTGTIQLPFFDGPVVLEVRFAAASQGFVRVSADGEMLEAIPATGGDVIERKWTLNSPRRLRFETSEVVRVAGDERELGLRLDHLELSQVAYVP